MSNPRFPDPFGKRELLEPGATASGGGLSLEQRVAALEQGAASKTRPILYYARMYLSGGATHTSGGGNHQTCNAGSGTATWVSDWDVRPAGVSAQVDTTNDAGKIYIRKTGIYSVQSRVQWGTMAATCWPSVSLFKNGSLLTSTHIDSGTGGATYGPIINAVDHVSLADGDYLELGGWQNSGGNVAYTTGGAQCRFSVFYIGPSV